MQKTILVCQEYPAKWSNPLRKVLLWGHALFELKLRWTVQGDELAAQEALRQMQHGGIRGRGCLPVPH